MPTERQLTVDQAIAEIGQLDIDRRIDMVIIHHCWEPPADKYRGIATVRGVRRFHMQQRGWSDNGYHIMIGPSGEIFSCRPFDEVGAHAAGHNSRSIGLSYIADFGGPDGPKGTHPDGRSTPLDDPATYAGLAAGQLVVAALCERFDLDVEDVRFHSEFSDKTCPGTLMKLLEYRKAVKRFMDGQIKVVLLTGDERPDFVIATSARRQELQDLFGDDEHIVLDAYKHIDDQGKVYIKRREVT